MPFITSDVRHIRLIIIIGLFNIATKGWIEQYAIIRM